MEKRPYYITTAIAYASAKPHIGNVYEAILADAIARFKRYEGYEVLFQTGTDEHGQKIQLKAEKAGIAPQQYVDNVAGTIKGLWDLVDCSYDKFVRTTDKEHERKVQEMFRRLYEQGDIYKGAYEGMYCTPCEAFFTPSQLKDGCCPDCGGKVEPAKEEAYFFKMSKYAPRLIEYINTHPDFIQPESRKNEMMNNFLLPGLQDLCVSRSSFSWGIPVDFDPKHVVYVWLDALSNYITNIGYEPLGENSEEFKTNWPADLHLIGKDIIRFHTIYWPIFLMALELPLPKQIFGHPWLLMGDGKMSKSKGNVLYADDLVKELGVDAVRYYVLREMPYDNDGTVSWEQLIERINADLANTLGNLVNRTVAMSNKYFGGLVEKTGAAEEIDAELKETVLNAAQRAVERMDRLRAGDALAEIFNIFKRCNKYVDETAPWALAKDESKQARLKEVLYNLCEGITLGTSLLSTFMPTTAEKIFSQLQTALRPFEQLNAFGLNPDSFQVAKESEILFARIDAKALLAKVKPPVEEQKPEEEAELPPLKEEIAFEDFTKLDLRLAKIVNCEEIKKAKKLFKLTVQLGKEERTIVSGIKKWYKAEELIGKMVVIIANLKPVTLCGVESRGMVLAAADSKEEALSLIGPFSELPSGSVVR